MDKYIIVKVARACSACKTELFQVFVVDRDWTVPFYVPAIGIENDPVVLSRARDRLAYLVEKEKE